LGRALRRHGCAVAAVVVTAGALCLVAFVWLDFVDFFAKEAYLNEAIKVGLSRSEVYRQVAKVGPYRVVRYSDGQCSPGRDGLFRREGVFVYPPIPNSFVFERYLCYDSSDRLVEITSGPSE
jgi:hypothetical protein